MGGLVGSAPIKGPKFDFDSEVRKIKRDKKWAKVAEWFEHMD